jgi:hypothetical protein
VGGFIGTLVLTTIARAASQAGWTRMDLPFLLGTTLTEDRRRARAIGYLLHFGLGLGFAMLYGLFFSVIGRSSWALGAEIGAVHAVFMTTVLVNVLLPVIHPKMATDDTAANHVTLIEPPGFLMLNYGRTTALVAVVAHMAYGGILGAVIRV